MYKLKYRGWFGKKAKRRCPHKTLRAIHGDEILMLDGYRLACIDCGQLIDGPVELARLRHHERLLP